MNKKCAQVANSATEISSDLSKKTGQVHRQWSLNEKDEPCWQVSKYDTKASARNALFRRYS